MDPALLLGDVDPANNFAMNGLAMHFACLLIADGHTLPPCLFIDILMEKSQTLKEFIRIQHVGLCLTANVRAQLATIRIYDTYTANANLLLWFTITNTLNLENRLFELPYWISIYLKKIMLCPHWRTYRTMFPENCDLLNNNYVSYM